MEKGNLLWSSLTYWKIATPEYKRIIGMILLFTLMNSSDMFLLLKARESGLSDVQTISLYIFYNLVYAISSYQMGILSDRIGKKKVFLIGLTCFIITYGGMAFNSRLEIFYLLFIFYGMLPPVRKESPKHGSAIYVKEWIWRLHWDFNRLLKV